MIFGIVKFENLNNQNFLRLLIIIIWELKISVQKQRNQKKKIWIRKVINDLGIVKFENIKN